jgi:hypothetical protein
MCFSVLRLRELLSHPPSEGSEYRLRSVNPAGQCQKGGKEAGIAIIADLSEQRNGEV